jgi:predicted DNA-binding protein
MSNFSSSANVRGRGSLSFDTDDPGPRTDLYVAAPAAGRPSKIGFAADAGRRTSQVSKDLGMDLQLVWQEPHPAAPEIEARVKTVLKDLTCDPNAQYYSSELFTVRPAVVIAVAKAEIARFAAEMPPRDGSQTSSDMFTFRISTSAAHDLSEFAEEKGQSVSEVLRERVRGYLSGTIVLKPLPDVWDASGGFPPASIARAAWTSRRFGHTQTFRLPQDLARRLRTRAGWQGRTASELMRRLVFHSGPAPTGADASGGEDGPGEGESTGDEPPKDGPSEGDPSEGSSSEGDSGESGARPM